MYSVHVAPCGSNSRAKFNSFGESMDCVQLYVQIQFNKNLIHHLNSRFDSISKNELHIDVQQ